MLKLTHQLEQAKLDDLTKRFDTLRQENELLKTRLEKSEKDTHEFVAYFQRELEDKEAERMGDWFLNQDPILAGSQTYMVAVVRPMAVSPGSSNELLSIYACCSRR